MAQAQNERRRTPVAKSPKPPPLPGEDMVVVPEPHRSQDAQIREAGFVIAARPACGPARWRRGRVIFVHAQALAIAKRLRAEKLAALEKAHG